jgi:ribosomal protein L40E
LTGSPRLATNPPNSILNYLYAILESETRLAAATLGLDPGIGVMHTDAAYRDSLALDLMEPIRAEVDAFVISWIKQGPLARNQFFEQRDGNCRLMAGFASTLSQTASQWAHLVGPVAEWFAREIAIPPKGRQQVMPSRLTQSNKRVAKGSKPLPKAQVRLKPQGICRNCGKQLSRDATHCKSCSTEIMTEQRNAAGCLARTAAQASEAQLKRAATQQVNALAQHAWKPSHQPSWLTADFYAKRIQPALHRVRASSIAKQLKVSYSYANDIRKGRTPHARHWKRLAELAGLGMSESNSSNGQLLLGL